MIVQLPEVFDGPQLRAELEAAGLVLTGFELGPGREAEAFFEEPFDPALVDQIIAAHVPEENRQLEQLAEKARRVWVGSDTFTPAQAQKILAGLVLLENRRR